jgi:ribosome-interacting GTPase 1
MEKYPGWLNINDTYKIKKDFAELKEIIEEIEKDINAFLGHKKTKYKGKRARKKLALLKNELIPQISRKILKTKQDYESDYS